jgi:hypothetical protein
MKSSAPQQQHQQRASELDALSDFAARRATVEAIGHVSPRGGFAVRVSHEGTHACIEVSAHHALALVLVARGHETQDACVAQMHADRECVPEPVRDVLRHVLAGECARLLLAERERVRRATRHSTPRHGAHIL